MRGKKCKFRDKTINFQGCNFKSLFLQYFEHNQYIKVQNEKRIVKTSGNEENETRQKYLDLEVSYNVIFRWGPTTELFIIN